MCEGFNLKYKRDQRDRLDGMKIVRWVGAILYNSNSKQKIKDPQKLYYLPEIDLKEKEIKLLTKKEMEEIKKEPFPRKLNDETLMDALKKVKKNGRSR